MGKNKITISIIQGVQNGFFKRGALASLLKNPLTQTLGSETPSFREILTLMKMGKREGENNAFKNDS